MTKRQNGRTGKRKRKQDTYNTRYKIRVHTLYVERGASHGVGTSPSSESASPARRGLPRPRSRAESSSSLTLVMFDYPHIAQCVPPSLCPSFSVFSPPQSMCPPSPALFSSRPGPRPAFQGESFPCLQTSNARGPYEEARRSSSLKRRMYVCTPTSMHLLSTGPAPYCLHAQKNGGGGGFLW